MSKKAKKTSNKRKLTACEKEILQELKKYKNELQKPMSSLEMLRLLRAIKGLFRKKGAGILYDTCGENFFSKFKAEYMPLAWFSKYYDKKCGQENEYKWNYENNKGSKEVEKGYDGLINGEIKIQIITPMNEKDKILYPYCFRGYIDKLFRYFKCKMKIAFKRKIEKVKKKGTYKDYIFLIYNNSIETGIFGQGEGSDEYNREFNDIIKSIVYEANRNKIFQSIYLTAGEIGEIEALHEPCEK